MKNQLLNTINENRDDFDMDQPDAKVWDNIHQQLHKEKKTNSFPWLKIASVLIISFGIMWFAMDNFSTKIKNSTNENLAQTSITLNDPDLIRKVIRGGNWKDIGYYLQNGTPTYDYLDSANSYVGYRSVMSYLGRGDVNYEWDGTPAPKIENNKNLDLLSGDLNHMVLYSMSSSSMSVSDVSNIVMYDNYSNSNPYISPGYYYEQYDAFDENKFVKTLTESVSTFSIDVDGAGYSNMRRYITDGFIPPKDAVKLEEMVNYFNYDLPEPTGEHPFSITTEVGKCPWNSRNQLLQISIKGKSIQKENLPPSNLVFLIDVSGSMSDQNKLPLLIKGFNMLVEELRPEDKVSIVVYAGAAGEVLPVTSGDKKEIILDALTKLEAGGSTAGGEGINLAYSIAEKNFIKNGNNRIILATDGDFNVGVSDDDALIKMIEEKRKSGVFVSVLGFGDGNLQSSKMEKIADNGNGNYSYIDNVLEAKKVLVTEFGGTLYTIAKDVKLQLEFNPTNVQSYRLLGYENRMLTKDEFQDDTKDAGDIGSGHTIVALYEIIPTRESKVDVSANLKYQSTTLNSDVRLNAELVTIKFRYKEPTKSTSKLLSVVVQNKEETNPSENFQFASAVAEFGLLIRASEYKSQANINALIKRAQANKGKDENGYRAEFIKICEMWKILDTEYTHYLNRQRMNQ